MKKYVYFFISIGIVFILYLLLGNQLDEVVKASKSIDLETFILLCFMQIGTIILVNGQWTSLGVVLLSKEVSYLHMFSIQAMATCMESITPSAKLGGEATRTMMLKQKYQIPYHESVALMVTQKFFSLLAFTCLCLLSMIYLFVTTSGVLFSIVVPSTILLAIIFVLFFFLIKFPKKTELIVRTFHLKVMNIYKVLMFVERFNGRIGCAVKNKHFFIKQVCFSFAIWLLFPIKAYMLSQSMHISLDFVTIAAISFCAYSVSMLPLTPGAIGTFETSIVLFLMGFYISSTEAMVYAIVLRFVTFWFVFLVCLIYGAIWFILLKCRLKRQVVKSAN